MRWFLTPHLTLSYCTLMCWGTVVFKKQKIKLGERNANANTPVCSDHFIRAMLASWLTRFLMSWNETRSSEQFPRAKPNTLPLGCLTESYLVDFWPRDFCRFTGRKLSKKSPFDSDSDWLANWLTDVSASIFPSRRSPSVLSAPLLPPPPPGLSVGSQGQQSMSSINLRNGL